MSKKSRRGECVVCSEVPVNFSSQNKRDADCLALGFIVDIIRASKHGENAALSRANFGCCCSGKPPPVGTFHIRSHTKLENLSRHVNDTLKILARWRLPEGMSRHEIVYVASHGTDALFNYLLLHHKIDIRRLCLPFMPPPLEAKRQLGTVAGESCSSSLQPPADLRTQESPAYVVSMSGTSFLLPAADLEMLESMAYVPVEEFEVASFTPAVVDNITHAVVTDSSSDIVKNLSAGVPAKDTQNILLDGEVYELSASCDVAGNQGIAPEVVGPVYASYLDLGADDVLLKEDQHDYELRDLLEIFVANEPSLRDAVVNRLLRLFRQLKPKMPKDWEKELPKDARSLLSRYTRKLQAKYKPEKIPCGLSSKDGIPRHNVQKRNEMLGLVSDIGTTIPVIGKHQELGDFVYFGVRDCLLMKSPGNTHVQNYMRTLRRVHAANKYLLSPALLRLVDKDLYQEERDEAWRNCKKDGVPENFHPKRPRMNCIYLRLFIDGVEVAKNSTRPSALPIAFSIERIVPFDEVKKVPLFDQGVIIPTMYAQPCIALSFHGKKKPCMHQLSTKLSHEADCYDPYAEDPPAHREFVFDFRCLIADTPMVSLSSGKCDEFYRPTNSLKYRRGYSRHHCFFVVNSTELQERRVQAQTNHVRSAKFAGGPVMNGQRSTRSGPSSLRRGSLQQICVGRSQFCPQNSSRTAIGLQITNTWQTSNTTNPGKSEKRTNTLSMLNTLDGLTDSGLTG